MTFTFIVNLQYSVTFFFRFFSIIGYYKISSTVLCVTQDCTIQFLLFINFILGFPGSSASKESSCNAGDPASICRSGRSPGEGIGYPLKYSWASLVAQLVKNLSAMWETWVWSLAWEDPLEKRKATHSSIPAWRIPWTVWSMGLQRVTHNWGTFTFQLYTRKPSGKIKGFTLQPPLQLGWVLL